MWAMLLSLMGGTFKDWLSNKQEVEKAKAIARIEHVKNGIPGYSDEYLVLVWSYPFIAAFIPALQPSVEAGFEFMEAMPDWYVGGFITVSFAVFGIDKLFKVDWTRKRGKSGG
jgi:hypothetical protein